jgi:hypothetical protein
LDLAGQLSFVLPYAVSIGLIVVTLVLLWQKKPVKRFLIGSLVTMFVVKLVSVGLQSLFYYLNLKQDAFGKILLQQGNGFFFNQVKESVQILVIDFILALIVLGVLVAINRWQKKPWLNEATPFVIAFLVLSLGNINFFISLLLGLVFSLFYLIYEAIYKHKYERVVVDPFVLIAGLIVLIAAWLPIYEKILSFLHLA